MIFQIIFFWLKENSDLIINESLMNLGGMSEECLNNVRVMSEEYLWNTWGIPEESITIKS